MHIVALHAFRDNYIWMLHDTRSAWVVDPGEPGPVLAACAAQGLELAGILVTHHHPDHVGGIAALCTGRAIPVWGPASENIPGITRPLHDGDRVQVGDLDFAVLAVPGHTLGHLAYHATGVLLCGDTLFSAGCGRLFEGTPAQMLASLDRLAALDPTTKVYCAHEYTLSNLQFARQVETESPALHDYQQWCEAQREAGRPTLPSSIAQELRVNPFLRVDAASVLERLSARAGRRPADRVEAFAMLRQWKDES